MTAARIVAAFEPLDRQLPADFADVRRTTSSEYPRDDERVVVRLTWAEWRTIRAAIDAMKEGMSRG
jgi:hypothetical protein